MAFFESMGHIRHLKSDFCGIAGRERAGVFITVPAHAQTFHLSKRETEILTLLVKGYTYKRIAAECFISMDTVRGHLKNTYVKLQVNSGKEAVAKALRHKIVEGE